MDISVILPVLNERENLCELIPSLKSVLEREGLSYEIVVIDGNSTDGTREAAAEIGARVVPERVRGYAGALMTGFEEAKGDYLLTLDADLSHDPGFVPKMWRARTRGDIVIASRYVRGGVTYNSFIREKLSDVLNWGFRRMLAMPVGDMSSGFRLYRREAIENLEIEARNFEVQEEILVKAYGRGFSVTEVPFTYFPRGAGSSHARVLSFGIDLARAAIKLRTMRNSTDSADYDERAFYSPIPTRSLLERRRHRITVAWARGSGRVLDVGCGSSVIVQSLNNVVGMDISLPKLRFLRRCAIRMVQGTAFELPFRDESFDCVIGSQLIEHLPRDEKPFTEMRRVLKSGGTLIIATQDGGSLPGWRITERLYDLLTTSAYRDSRVTQYTRGQLEEILARYGFSIEGAEYVSRRELVMKCRKVLPAAGVAESASQTNAA